MKTIHRLGRITDAFDLLVMDDHSVDSTISDIRELGINVITKDKAMGLTDSWNAAYKLWKRGPWKQMFLMNNDIWLSSGTMTRLEEFLRYHPFAGCMSTLLGVGHQPEQAIDNLWTITKAEKEWAERAENCDLVNQALERAVQSYRGQNLTFDMSNTLAYKDLPFFNGFFFGFRKPDIYQAEFSQDVLFDPKNINTGQEGDLSARLERMRIPIRVPRFVFAFHFKSQTLWGDERDKLSIWHPEMRTQRS